MQRSIGLLGAAGAIVVLFAACGGKVVVDGSNGSGDGGAGGAGGSSGSVLDGPFSAVAVTSATTGVTVGVTTVSVGSTSATTGSGMSCTSCGDAITDPNANPNNLCPKADALYNELITCVCAGLCATQCGANACIGDDISDACNACIGDTGQGCGFELNNCLNN